jgi:hypothetical protein
MMGRDRFVGRRRNCGCRSSDVGRGRLGCGRPLGGAGMVFSRGGRSGRRDWGLDHDGNGRRHYDCGTCGHNCAHRWPGDYGARGWTGSDGWWGRRRNHDGRRGTRLGHDFARLRTGRSYGRCGRDGSLRRCRLGRRYYRRRRGAHGCVGLPRLGFSFLLLGEDGLHHVAGFGNMGEIYLGLDALRGARGRPASLAARP